MHLVEYQLLLDNHQRQIESYERRKKNMNRFTQRISHIRHCIEAQSTQKEKQSTATLNIKAKHIINRKNT